MIPALDIRPGDQLHRTDTGQHVYTVQQVEHVLIDHPDHPVPLPYIRAQCVHHDTGRVHPHFWAATDTTPLDRKD